MPYIPFLALGRAFAYAAVLALTLRSASADPSLVSISGFVLHCDSHNARSVDLGDTVRVTDGRQTYAVQVNSDGSYALNVGASPAYNLYVYSSRKPSPVWQQRVTAGRQQTICIAGGSS
jgi:hypothetical protein